MDSLHRGHRTPTLLLLDALHFSKQSLQNSWPQPAWQDVGGVHLVYFALQLQFAALNQQD